MPLPVLASPARRYQSSIRSLTQDSFAHTRLNPSTVLVGSARQIGLLRMPDSASNAHEDKRVLGRPFLTLASRRRSLWAICAGLLPKSRRLARKRRTERLRAAEMAAQQALILPRLSRTSVALHLRPLQKGAAPGSPRFSSTTVAAWSRSGLSSKVTWWKARAALSTGLRRSALLVLSCAFAATTTVWATRSWMKSCPV